MIQTAIYKNNIYTTVKKTMTFLYIEIYFDTLNLVLQSSQVTKLQKAFNIILNRD